MGEQVCRCCSGIVRYNESLQGDYAEYCGQEIEQINDAGDPGPRIQRYGCDRSHWLTWRFTENGVSTFRIGGSIHSFGVIG